MSHHLANPRNPRNPRPFPPHRPARAALLALALTSLLPMPAPAATPAVPASDLHAAANGLTLALENREGKLHLRVDGQAALGTLLIYRAASLAELRAPQSVAARLNTTVTPGLSIPLPASPGAIAHEFFMAEHSPGVLTTNTTFGPEIVEPQLVAAAGGTYRFTLRSRLGGSSLPDQYSVKVVGPDGKLLDGVQWTGALSGSGQTTPFSTDGQESTFTVKLPAKPAAPASRYGILWGALRQVIRPLTIVNLEEKCCLIPTPEIEALRISDLNRGWQQRFGFVEASGAAVDISAIGTPAPSSPKLTGEKCELHPDEFCQDHACKTSGGPAGGEQTDVERDFRVVFLSEPHITYRLILSSTLVPQVSQEVELLVPADFVKVNLATELACDNAPLGGSATASVKLQRMPDTVIIVDRPIWNVGFTMAAVTLQPTRELTVYTENTKLDVQVGKPHTLRLSARRQSAEFGEAYAIAELTIAP